MNCHPERSARLVFATRFCCESSERKVEGSAVAFSGCFFRLLASGYYLLLLDPRIPRITRFD